MKIQKSLIVLFLAVSALAGAVPARAALLSGVRLDRVIRIDRLTCGIQIDILDDGLDIPVLNRIKVGDSVLALLDLDLGAQTNILVASASMEDLLDIDADVVIDDSLCDLLRPGSSVSLLGLLGSLLNLQDALTLPSDFGDLTAFVFDLNLNDHLLVHLDDDVLDLSNSDGDSGSVGGDPGTGNTGGGGDTVTSDGTDSGINGGALPGAENAVSAGGGCSLNGGSASGLRPFFLGAAFLILGLSCGIRSLVPASKRK